VLFFHDFVSAPLSYSFNIYVLYKKMWLRANYFVSSYKTKNGNAVDYDEKCVEILELS